jgi:hypothetical protein
MKQISYSNVGLYPDSCPLSHLSVPRIKEAIMTTTNKSWKVFPSFIVTLVVSVLLAAGSASAADLTVICPGGGPGAYPSITAALNAIANNAGPNSITVSGTCTENIVLRNQNDLNIHAAQGSAAVITNAANPAQITVRLEGSRLVVFNGLSIQGGDPGVFVSQGSDLQMINSVIEKNVGTGAIVLVKSDLNLDSCVIRNNASDGVLVGDSSIVLVLAPVQILNNNGNGAVAFSNGYIKFQSTGGHLIEGNGGDGIIAATDGHVFLQSGNAPTVIRNNGGDGLAFVQGSTGRVDGQNTIQNNGGVGLRVVSSAVQFVGTPAGSTITGHGPAGVVVARGGELTFDGPHQITGNGNPANGVGIRVERSSLNLQNGATVSNNTGTGILGDAHSGIVIGPSASVTNNTSTGIQLRRQSLIGLTAPATIEGNGGANIKCDSTSLAYGQVSGTTRIQCNEE